MTSIPGDQKDRENIRQHARDNTGEDRHEQPKQSHDHRIDAKVLAHPAADARQHFVRCAAI